jgi:hypothetical protein
MARAITLNPILGSSRSRTTASSSITDSRSRTTGARAFPGHDESIVIELGILG